MELRRVWNGGFLSMELRGCVELRGFWCGTERGGTEGFSVWNGGGFGVELKDFWG